MIQGDTDAQSLLGFVFFVLIVNINNSAIICLFVNFIFKLSKGTTILSYYFKDTYTMASHESGNSKVSSAVLSKPSHQSPAVTADYGSSSMDTKYTAHAALNSRVSVYFANSNTPRRRDYWVSDAGDARMTLANQRAAKTSGAHGGDRFGGRKGTEKLQRQHTVYYKDLQKLKDAVNNEEVASGTAVVKPIHYKPDWFPVSVRQIDRDGNKVRTGLNGQQVNPAPQADEETTQVCQMIEKVVVLRDKSIFQPKKGVVEANKAID